MPQGATFQRPFRGLRLELNAEHVLTVSLPAPVPAAESRVPPGVSAAASRTTPPPSMSETDPFPESVPPPASAGTPNAIPASESGRTLQLSPARNPPATRLPPQRSGTRLSGWHQPPSPPARPADVPKTSAT